MGKHTNRKDDFSNNSPKKPLQKLKYIRHLFHLYKTGARNA